MSGCRQDSFCARFLRQVPNHELDKECPFTVKILLAFILLKIVWLPSNDECPIFVKIPPLRGGRGVYLVGIT